MLKTTGQELKELLSKKWINVTYKNGRGYCSMGCIDIRWEDSSNEDAVHISLTVKSTKAFDAEEIVKSMTKINKLMGNF